MRFLTPLFFVFFINPLTDSYGSGAEEVMLSSIPEGYETPLGKRQRVADADERNAERPSAKRPAATDQPNTSELRDFGYCFSPSTRAASERKPAKDTYLPDALDGLKDEYASPSYGYRPKTRLGYKTPQPGQQGLTKSDEITPGQRWNPYNPRPTTQELPSYFTDSPFVEGMSPARNMPMSARKTPSSSQRKRILNDLTRGGHQPRPNYAYVAPFPYDDSYLKLLSDSPFVPDMTQTPPTQEKKSVARTPLLDRNQNAPLLLQEFNAVAAPKIDAGPLRALLHREKGAPVQEGAAQVKRWSKYALARPRPAAAAAGAGAGAVIQGSPTHSQVMALAHKNGKENQGRKSFLSVFDEW